MSTNASIAAVGERKLAVIVFVDLTGYTELVRRHDPEAVVSTVQPVIALMRRAIENEGGNVPSVAGDGFMAVFGVPTAAADLASAALRSASAIRRAISAVNRAPGAFRVPDVHIGIAAGEVLVTPSDEPSGWSLVGNAVNLASRLCDAAAANEILVDEQFRRLAGAGLSGATNREIAVKGVADRLGVWAVDLGDPPTPAVPAAAFVDRVDELRHLDAAWEEVAALGLSRVVLVAADSGLGKTRLVRHWLTERRHPHDWVWCGDRTDESTLVTMTRQVATDPDASERLAAALVERSDPTRPDPFPAVAAAARHSLVSAASAPRVLVLDDADRADASLLEFLTGVRESPVAAPMLVLTTWRSDDSRPPWPPDLELRPLSADAARALLANALHAEPPAQVADAVTDRSAGHPLMILQSAAYVVEAGIVAVADGSCTLRSPAEVENLPTSLRLFVAARIDRLPAREKSALQELSTCGEASPDDIASRIFKGAVLELLPRLQERGLLRRGHNGWEFTHGVVQQVAYASLPRTARAELHRRQWEAYDERATGARLYHALRWADCLTSAGHDSRRVSVGAALEAALAHARTVFSAQADAALQVVRQVSQHLDDYSSSFPALASELRSLSAMCLIEMDLFDAALEESNAALEAAEEVPDSARTRLNALLVRGQALARLRRTQTARQTLEEAQALAVSLRDAASEGRALRLLGDTWRHHSFPEFVALVERAHETLLRAGEAPTAGEYAAFLAYLTSFGGPRQFQRWRATAERAGTARARLWLSRADAEANRIRWYHERAATAAQEAVILGETLGATDSVADGLSVTIHAATAQGRLQDGVAAYEQLRGLAVRTDNPRMRLMAAAAGALPLLRSGRVSDAEHELRHALDIVDAFGEGEAGEAYTGAAVVARDRGRWADAARHIAEVTKVGLAADFLMDVVHSRALEAGIYVELDDRPSAASLHRLAEECASAEAGPMAAYVRALEERVVVLEGGTPTLRSEPLTLEEAAVRRDTEALAAEQSGSDADAAWAEAARTWERLGTTVYLARAQARSRDTAAATATLDLIRADEAAREWALSR